MKLVNSQTKQPIRVGDKAVTFRNESCRVTGMIPPKHQGSTGRIELTIAGSIPQLFYPSVIGAEWIEDTQDKVEFGLSCAILHNIGNPQAPQRFEYLSQALKAAWEQKVTGYIVTPANEVINIKAGKRKANNGKHWVPCNVGL